MIATVTMNPAVDKTVEVDDLRLNGVNRIKNSRLDAGGKGINVSKTIATLGGLSMAAAILGGAGGEFIGRSLAEQNIEGCFVWCDGETRTNLKIVDKVSSGNTDINESGPRVSKEKLDELKLGCLKRLQSGDVLVLSGSVPPGVASDIYFTWIEEAKKNGLRTILDADGDLLESGIKAGPYLIKPNIHEIERLAGRKLEQENEAAEFAGAICRQYGIAMAVISLGENGALFVKPEGAYLAAGLRVKVESTVGAGDAMVAALALALDGCYDWDRLIRLAVAAGTASVMTRGTEPGDRCLVEKLAGQVKWKKI